MKSGGITILLAALLIAALNQPARVEERGASAPDPSGLVAAAKQRSVPLDVVSIDAPAIARIYERPLVLVRPDGHVAWRAAMPPPDPLAIVDAIRGA